MLKRVSGISLRTSRGALSKSQSFEGVVASPGKRQALPTMAMGSPVCSRSPVIVCCGFHCLSTDWYDGRATLFAMQALEGINCESSGCVLLRGTQISELRDGKRYISMCRGSHRYLVDVDSDASSRISLSLHSAGSDSEAVSESGFETGQIIALVYDPHCAHQASKIASQFVPAWCDHGCFNSGLIATSDQG